MTVYKQDFHWGFLTALMRVARQFPCLAEVPEGYRISERANGDFEVMSPDGDIVAPYRSYDSALRASWRACPTLPTEYFEPLSDLRLDPQDVSFVRQICDNFLDELSSRDAKALYSRLDEKDKGLASAILGRLFLGSILDIGESASVEDLGLAGVRLSMASRKISLSVRVEYHATGPLLRCDPEVHIGGHDVVPSYAMRGGRPMTIRGVAK